MKDAFGGIMNLAMIVAFLMIVSGVLGLTVSYTKVFKFKNFVISTIENYEGGKGCFDPTLNNGCFNTIKQKAERIGYAPGVEISCHGYTRVDNLFCYKKEYSGAGTNEVKYKIITQIDVDIPIINKIVGSKVFQVTGDTRTIKRR